MSQQQEVFDALVNLQKEIRAHHKMNVKKDYSLMVADAQASKVILMAQRESKADEVLAAYKFGSDELDDGNVTVVGHDNWDRSDPSDFTKFIYVQYRDEPAEADSHKVSFHVRFNNAGEVEDAYALEMGHGNDIGCRGDIYAAAPAMA